MSSSVKGKSFNESLFNDIIRNKEANIMQKNNFLDEMIPKPKNSTIYMKIYIDDIEKEIKKYNNDIEKIKKNIFKKN